MEATSSDRVGEPSQFQARLVKFFLVLILLTVPGALSFLFRAEETSQATSAAPTGDRVARQVDARNAVRDAILQMRLRLFDHHPARQNAVPLANVE